MDGGIIRIRDGERAAVRGNDADARFQQLPVAGPQRFAVGAVHKEGSFRRRIDDRPDIVSFFRGDGVPAGVDAIEAAVGKPLDAEPFPRGLGNGLAGASHQFQQGLPDRTGAGDEQDKVLPPGRLEKGAVDRLQRQDADPRPHYDDDIAAFRTDFHGGDAHFPECGKRLGLSGGDV